MRIMLMVLAGGIPLTMGALVIAGYLKISNTYIVLMYIVGVILFHSIKRYGKRKPTP